VELSQTDIIQNLYGPDADLDLNIYAADGVWTSLTDFSLWEEYGEVTITLKRGQPEAARDHEFGHAWLGARNWPRHRDDPDNEDKATKAGKRLRELVDQKKQKKQKKIAKIKKPVCKMPGEWWGRGPF
jgi:hypothetical protein